MKKILIIGAGIIGCSIAYLLSKYELDVEVIEKSSYVGSGATKANSSMLHQGLGTNPNSLRGKLVVGGKEKVIEVCKKLNVPFHDNVGIISLALNEDHLPSLFHLLEDAKRLNIHGEMLSREQTLELEPNLNPEIVGSFFSNSVGTVSPYELAIALAEVAALNKVQFTFGTVVTSMTAAADSVLCQLADGTSRTCNMVINCAGIHSDEVARLVGDSSFSLTPRHGEYVLYDRQIYDQISHIISVPGSAMSKGMVLVPLDHGNLLAGSSAENVEDKQFLDTKRSTLDLIYSDAIQKMCPSIPKNSNIITSFSGNRSISNTNDYIIEFSDKSPYLLNVAGIQSPGLTSCLNIAEYVLNKLEESHPTLLSDKKTEWIENREIPVKVTGESPENISKIMERSTQYGKIICRCEQVTYGAIVDSIKGIIPTTTLDAIKRKLRVGMGKCQGGYCTNKVISILVGQLNIDESSVLKDLEGSNLLYIEERCADD